MKIRMLRATNVAADPNGITSRRLLLGEVYEASVEWERDLFARLVDAGHAEEADKAFAPPETKTTYPRKRRSKR